MSDLQNALRVARKYPLVTAGIAFMVVLSLLTPDGQLRALGFLAFLVVVVPLSLGAKLLLQHLDRRSK